MENFIVDTGDIFIGHLGGYKQDCIGYISFDISDLSRIECVFDSPFGLLIPTFEKYEPRDAFNELYISGVDYGATPLYSGVKDLPDIIGVLSLPATSDYVDHNSEGIMFLLATAIQEGRDRVQFRMKYSDYSSYSDSSETHGIRINRMNVGLNVTYYER